LKNYFERLKAEANSKHASRATKIIFHDPRIVQAIELTNTASFEHPKLERVVGAVSEQLRSKKDSRIIVFTHYRDTSEIVVETLNKVKDVRAVRFVGQATKDNDIGLSQKEQVEIIKKFKDGEYNALVATAVAEEGLDIPSTDLVVLYEPVPSEIRTIQRRGRTGRKKPGKMVVLITKRTRDEAYYWSSRSKESKMKSTLHLLRSELKDRINIGEPPSEEEMEDMKTKKQPTITTHKVRVSHDFDIDVEVAKNIPKKKGKKEIQTTLAGFVSIEKPHESLQKPIKQENVAIPQIKSLVADKQHIGAHPIKDSLGTEELVEPVSKGAVPEIIVDTREFASGVARELSNLGLIVHPRQLSIGDYILSERIGVERKEVDDFLQSIIDGRLFSQALALKRAYLRPILLIEGEDLFTARQISQTAIYGALASVVSDFNIPIFFTKDEKETALFLATISKQEIKEGRVAKVRGEKGAMSMRERQQFIIEGLPNVSATLAQRLLSHFGSIGTIFNASTEQLCEVKGVGKKTAEEIRKIVDEKYLG
jgi:Fanconi anemia group M protein